MMNPNADITVPARMVPSFAAEVARERKAEKNIMIRTWGGIGDQICAEPSIRFAVENFKDCEISIATEYPELFSHLKFKDVFNLKREQPLWEKYLTLTSVKTPQDLSFEFISHMLINCIDYPSICMFRAQIPNSYKPVQLKPRIYDLAKASTAIEKLEGQPIITVHPGKHWQTKTFPKDWWDQVLFELQVAGLTPVLIGDALDDNRGTVDVNPEGCIDLRGQLPIMQSVAILQNCDVLITNDSAPIHMAASGNAWIGFIATAKHPDLVTHWRTEKSIWSWRMKNLGKGGYWDIDNFCPNKASEVSAEFIEPEILRSWLPEPLEVSKWTQEKIREL